VAISFTPLQLKSCTHFGIRLKGSFGRSDKSRLRNLAAKCLANRKIRLVLELSELASLGGGGAAELATLQRQLEELGGELIIVGASSTILQFLARGFDGLYLRCYQSIDIAEQDLLKDAADGSAAAVARQSPERSSTETPVAAMGTAPDSTLDEILGLNNPEVDNPPIATASNAVEDPVLPSETPPPDPPDRSQPASRPDRRIGNDAGGNLIQNERGSGCRHYVSLSETVSSLQEASGSEDLGVHLLNLLHSHDLAKEVWFCQRQGHWFLGEDGKRAFTATGRLALTLASAQRPLSLLDIPADELDNGESRFLSAISPDLILPVLWQGQLQAVAFLKRGKKDHEYSVSEHFALELLMRVMAAYGDRRAETDTEQSAGSGRSGSDQDADLEQLWWDPDLAESSTDGEDLAEPADDEMLDTAGGGSLAQASLIWTRCLLRFVETMAGAMDEEMFWERVHQRLLGDLGVDKLVVLVPTSEGIMPQVTFGVLQSKASRLAIGGVTGRRYLESVARPVTAVNLPSSFKKFQTAMQKADLKWLVPLQADLDWIGIALLGEVVVEGKPSLNEDQAAEMFTKVAMHLQRLRERSILENRNLEIIKRLMSLMEERHYGPGGMSSELIHLVRLVAREMDFPPEQERDLIYGTIIRDIGMFPTGDMIIDSFGNVSEEQWQEYRSHPTLGAERLEGLSVSATVRDVVLYHHERFNGEGYPHGCEGHDIPLAARIIAVVENYVAMVTTMPNRPALSRTQALEIIQENFGNRYDPEVVAAFLSVIESEKRGPQPATALVQS